MSSTSISTPNEILEKQTKPGSFIYLPEEGLQGEDIPSHILWENAKAEHIQVSFCPPLKFKEIFNAESYEIRDNDIIVKKVELEGYLGLSFETSKVSDLEVAVPVKYLVHLSDGDVIEELKMIKLFKPQLEIKVLTKEITIRPETGFVKGRIGIRNIGRGTLIISISTAEDSSRKLETPPGYREFAEKFLSDVLEELSKLGKEFPQFQPLLDEMVKWETEELMELSDEERDEFREYINKLGNALASDKNLLQGFVEAYAKAFAKNSEFIEAVRKFVKVYESLVSKDILLVNPFDEVTLTRENNEIALEISQTDRVFDAYDDILLPKIELISSQPVKVPAYKLFDWG